MMGGSASWTRGLDPAINLCQETRTRYHCTLIDCHWHDQMFTKISLKSLGQYYVLGKIIVQNVLVNNEPPKCPHHLLYVDPEAGSSMSLLFFT